MSEEEHAAFNAKVQASVATRRTKSTPAPSKRQEHSTTNPLSPEIDSWLRSIEPRLELTARYAMRGHWMTVRASRAFSARVKELEGSLKLDANQLAMVLDDVRRVESQIEELIAGKPPKR